MAQMAKKVIDPDLVFNQNHFRKLQFINDMEKSIYLEEKELKILKKHPVQRRSLNQNPVSHKDVNSDEFWQVIQCKSNVTPAEMLFMMLRLASKCGFSLECFTDLCKLINTIFSKPVLPLSPSIINEIFEKRKVKYYEICRNCHAVLPNVNTSTAECQLCKNAVSVPKNYSDSTFALLDPSDAISELISMYANHYDFVVKDRTSTKGLLKDIYDGEKYQSFVRSLPVEDKHQYVTLTIYTAGVRPFNSTNAYVWPIQIMINELPIEKRFKHILTVGLWYGKSQPRMQVYIKEFIKMIRQSRSKGIPCTIKGEKRFLKVFVINSVVDTPARKELNQKVHFNAYEGCDWCYIKGTHHEGSVRYLEEGPLKLRDAEETKQYMLKAAVDKEKSIHGVKDISPLLFLKEFDINESFVVDLMHAIDEGVTKQETRFILEKKLVPAKTKLIDEYLLQVRALTTKISESSDWTGRQWQNWRLFYSLPILEAVGLDEKYLEQWSLLVNSLHILLSDAITTEDLTKADQMLRKYVTQTQSLYGPEYMTYNVHQLVHIAKCVDNFGPLQILTAYPFEAANGQLLNALHSANGDQKQFIANISMNYTGDIIKTTVYRQAHMLVKEFYEDAINQSGGPVEVEKGIFFNCACQKNDEIIKKFKFSHNSKFFTKMFKKSFLYQSSTIPNLRSCDSYAKLSDGKFIKVLYFVSSNGKNYCVCHIVNSTPHRLSDYIHVCLNESSESISIDVKEIERLCKFMEIAKLRFISPRPNMQILKNQSVG